MEESTVNYEIGDIVEVEMWGDGTRRISVTEKRERIKKGRPGFCGVLVSATTPKDGEIGDEVWAYDFQIVSVLRLSEKNKKKQWERVGVIGVDSATCWIGDPCYIIHSDETKFELGRTWEEFVDTTSGSLAHQFNYNSGRKGLGVSVMTGKGDGFYPVEVEGGSILAVLHHHALDQLVVRINAFAQPVLDA